MAKIVLNNIVKRYGALTVLKNVNLEIGHGEFVVLVGPSGCGKSTLLRILAGLERVSEGDILVNDRRVNDLPARKRNVSMVFQSYALFPHLKVDRNISFGLELQKESKESIDKKVYESASLLNLSKYLKRFPRQLSGGQRQRVAMGRAIVRQPSMFLFDEPLSNLDAKLRVNMRAEIKALHMRLKNTIVYVTHDQVEAMTMADRIVVMNDGRIEQEGAPLELYDRPQTKFVAGFLGSPAMNFLDGESADDGLRIGGLTTIPAPATATRKKVSIGVRPEHIFVDGGDIPAKVKMIEPTGADTLIHLDLGGNSVTAVSHARLGVSPGDDVKIRFDVDHLHFFDSESGRRL